MDPQTKNKIEQFITINEKVKNARFTKETKTVSFELNFEVGKPLEQKVTGFDEEDLRSMLMDLRKFLIKRDDVFLPEICALLIANTSNQELLKNIRKCKDLYDQLMKEPAIRMIIDSETETGKAIMNKWLYGYYFHEKQHREDLQRLGASQHIHKANFVFSITELIKISSWVANNAKIILGIS